VAYLSFSVILDSEHSKAHVLKELEIYGGLVSQGSYLILTDTHLNGHPVTTHSSVQGGPMEALEEWLPKHPEFHSDRTRERWLYTWNPLGYLKKG
jgi:cephalosporin hydroxylase